MEQRKNYHSNLGNKSKVLGPQIQEDVLDAESIFKVELMEFSDVWEERRLHRMRYRAAAFPCSLSLITSCRQLKSSPCEICLHDPFQQFTRLFRTTQEKAEIITIKSGSQIIPIQDSQPAFSTFHQNFARRKFQEIGEMES